MELSENLDDRISEKHRVACNMSYTTYISILVALQEKIESAVSDLSVSDTSGECNKALDTIEHLTVTLAELTINHSEKGEPE